MATARPLHRAPAAATVTAVPDRSSGEPRVRGGRVLAWLERPVVLAESALARALPAHLDPLAQPGAAANACLLVAIATGIAILPWYVPSVHDAHASVAAMQASLLPRTLRALHRWSSDAAMAFVLLHALRLLLARRVTGARWLAWVTGAGLLALLWAVGWLGYWLVWDEAARQVALATARAVDVLPIGGDPVARSFVSDSTLGSLLFFVVFFVHMLLPLGMGLGLWLHVVRTARPRFLPGRPLCVAMTLALTAIALAVPAPLGGPARMAEIPGQVVVDAWYLAPLAVAERLPAGAGVALAVGALVALATLPWTLAKGRTRTATVDAAACNACTRCVADCPFAAITMAPREGEGRSALVAEIDPARCVGCGICSGSCEPSAIGLPWLDQQAERRRLDAWLAESPADAVVLACEGSAGGSLRPDAATGRAPGVPATRVMLAPCAGWFSPFTVERALRRGTGPVIVVGCPEPTCRFREGDDILGQRLAGTREPALRRDKVDLARLNVVRLARHESRALIRLVAATPPPARAASGARPGLRAVLAGACVAGLLGASVVAVGAARHVPAQPDGAQLVVAFSHRGRDFERCRDRTPDELAALPPHMRTPQECTRGRAPVRLRVSVDGREVHAGAHPAAGAWGDGPSRGVVTLDVPEGEHVVEVAIGDTHDPHDWAFVEARTLALGRGTRRAVLFDRAKGFTWE